MRISQAVLQAMLDHARRGYPFEVCGILVGEGESVRDAVPVTNHEVESPRVRYRIDPAEHIRIQREARERRLDIIGFYHSHPDHPARPSETDRRIAAEGLSDGVFHVVVGIAAGTHATPTAWAFRDQRQDFEPVPLEAE